MEASGTQAQSRDDATWLLIGLTLLLALGFGAGGQIGIATASLVPAAALLLVLRLFGRLARMAPNVHALAASLPAFQQILAFSVAGAALSYILAANQRALWDGRFLRWDSALGFDRTAFFGLLDAHPLLAWANGIFYYSLIPMMILLVLALAQARRVEAMRVVMFASAATGLAAILLSGAMPAMGNLFSPADYPNLGASAAWLHRGDIAGLRDGSLRLLDFGQMKGIVTFPSYHAALAAIYIWGFAQLPRLRAAGTLWAVGIVAATPAGGGHYLVDVMAGIGLAAAAIPIARRAVLLDLGALLRRQQTARRLASSAVPAATASARRSAGEMVLASRMPPNWS